MKTLSILKLTLGMAACGSALLNAQVGSALSYHIDVTTLSLVGNPTGPFSLDFQLNDGHGTGDGNNTAIISGFNFNGGSATGAPSLFGGASGSLSSSVTLIDNTPFNEFFQTFTPGSKLDFDLSLTQNLDAGLTPDEFSFAILDGTLGNVTTTLPGDSLFQVDITKVPTVRSGSGTGIAGLATTVPDAPSQSTLGIAALSLAGAGWVFRKKQAIV